MQDAIPDVEFRMYDREPFTDAELSRIMGSRPVTDFLNPRSIPYKKLGLARKKVSKSQFLKLMHSDPNLLRRPMVIKGRKILFGVDEKGYKNL